MRLIIALALALASSLGLFAAAGSQAESAHGEAVVADQHPLAWLEGHWVGEGFGGEAEEIWLAPEGGVMSCIFRLSVKDKVSFYELVTIGPAGGEGDGWEMRLKHFHADLRGWEERDESLQWPYEPLGERAARFGPVTYELSDEDVLTATVEVGTDSGAESEALVFRRKE